jgi:hypothetical protein
MRGRMSKERDCAPIRQPVGSSKTWGNYETLTEISYSAML